MNPFSLRRLILVAIGLAYACSGSSGSIDKDTVDAASAADQRGGDSRILPDGLAPSDAGQDLVFDLPDLALDVEPDLLTPACDPGEGCFLDPCTDNAECQSGWCVEHLGEGVCTQTCQEECPQGWACKQVGGTGPDVLFVCVSQYANLCKPCADNDDCKSPGGAEDACVAYGPGGSFCGGTCDSAADCPWGFSCVESLTVDGLESTQCVADTGTCPCTEKAISLSLWTACEVTSEFGTCTGKRVCTQSGLTACDAAIPAAESCDGLDNDCDGEADEPDLVEGDYVNLCDDANACTDDACMGEQGCSNTALDEGSCDDGNPCTVADHCEAGSCVAETVNCDDDNPCTDDECTANGGCEHVPNTAQCDDQNPCTVGDFCADSACSGTAVDCDCQDNTDCGALEDGDLCNGTLLCDTTALPYQCVVAPESVIDCPAPEGIDAFCLQPACNPADGQCSFAPEHEGWACTDDDLCTVNTACLEGSCTGGEPLNCNDGNPCTDDTCDPATGCVHTPNTAPCQDGDACTVGDICADGECTAGLQLACDDGNQCTNDSCSPESGCLHAPMDEAPCDDSNACTADDLCVGTVCQGLSATDCDDDNLCTTDSCTPATGCLHSPNTAPCDDGDACTTGDTCAQGVCTATEPLSCADNNPCTDDACDPATGCVYTLNDAPCDDYNACTTGESCSGGVCLPGDWVSCDDGIDCTVDSCSAVLGCQVTPVDGACDDGVSCTLDSCDLEAGCLHAPQNAQCDDAIDCTVDTCHETEDCQHLPVDATCDDNVACTLDSCSAAQGCIQDPQHTLCDDENVCTDDVCTPQGCTYNALDGTGCDDGDEATVDDSCAGSQCVGLPDPDGDGIANSGYDGPCTGGNATQCNDNCPDDANAEQADWDNDGEGDVCDCSQGACSVFEEDVTDGQLNSDLFAVSWSASCSGGGNSSFFGETTVSDEQCLRDLLYRHYSCSSSWTENTLTSSATVGEGNFYGTDYVVQVDFYGRTEDGCWSCDNTIHADMEFAIWDGTNRVIYYEPGFNSPGVEEGCGCATHFHTLNADVRHTYRYHFDSNNKQVRVYLDDVELPNSPVDLSPLGERWSFHWWGKGHNFQTAYNGNIDFRIYKYAVHPFW